MSRGAKCRPGGHDVVHHEYTARTARIESSKTRPRQSSHARTPGLGDSGLAYEKATAWDPQFARHMTGDDGRLIESTMSTTG
jgi:hypothetical protein